MSFLHRFSVVPAIGALLLAVCFGYLLGRLTARTLALKPVPVAVIEDARAPLSTVAIAGIENGMLNGTIFGGARLIIDGHPVIPNGSGAFRVAASPLLTDTITVTVPVGMEFVASKRGKKYYPVTSAAGQNLAVQNRIYFATSAEAERAGFYR